MAVPIGRSAWDETRPGALEVNLVAHDGGGSSSGHDAASLSVVDVVSGWSRQRAVLGKSQAAVQEALQRLLSAWPTPVWGLRSDTGTEFLNEQLIRYCQQHAIAYHRSRAGRNNDNAHVAQRNRRRVREVIGYARNDQFSDAHGLNGVLVLLDEHVNLVLPSQKLMGKTRDGAKVRKRYDGARAPLERLLDVDAIEPQRQAHRTTARPQPVGPQASPRRSPRTRQHAQRARLGRRLSVAPGSSHR